MIDDFDKFVQDVVFFTLTVGVAIPNVQSVATFTFYRNATFAGYTLSEYLALFSQSLRNYCNIYCRDFCLSNRADIEKIRFEYLMKSPIFEYCPIIKFADIDYSNNFMNEFTQLMENCMKTKNLEIGDSTGR